MNGINRKPLIFEKLQEFANQNPEYSFGEMLFSIVNSCPTKIKLEGKADLLNITDVQFYSGVDGAINNETKETEFFQDGTD